jgi:hypothetical protein
LNLLAAKVADEKRLDLVGETQPLCHALNAPPEVPTVDFQIQE